MTIMAYDELPARAIEHVFTAEDRVQQLGTLARLCDRLANLLTEHGERAEGEQFRARAEAAQHLLSAGFARQDLNDVGGQFPTGPWWLNPKALDSGSPREPWQEEVATLHAEASTTATDLRAVATLTDL
jgi:hypothetical protein